MVISFFLLALAPAASSPFGIFESITAREAAKRVSGCGLGPVTTHYQDDLQEDVLVAAEAKSATDGQLACADQAVSFYTLELPPTVQGRYDTIRNARLAVAFKAQARSWLSARGILDKVPAYKDGVTNDGAFTQRVESLCGARAKGAFRSKFGFHALSPDWLNQQKHRPDFGTGVLSCLINVTTVAGFKFGFVGNEYYQR